MHVHSSAPSPWVLRFAHLVPAGGRVLDLASGSGRHAHLFAARGSPVLAVDRDASLLAGLAGVAGITTRAADLEAGTWPLKGERFDAVIATNYLYRPLLAQLADALAPDGTLLYETFADGNARFGKPSNPDFLLRPGELLAVFGARLTVVAFEQGEVHSPGRSAVMQRLAAVGTARPWPPLLASAANDGAARGQ